MKTIKRFKQKKLSQFNIRQLNNGKYVVYRGIVSQSLYSYKTIKLATEFIKSLIT